MCVGRAELAEIQESILHKLTNDLVPTLVVSAALWVPMHTANYIWMPPRFQIVSVSLFAVAWGCFLSLVQHKEGDFPLEEEDAEAKDLLGGGVCE